MRINKLMFYKAQTVLLICAFLTTTVAPTVARAKVNLSGDEIAHRKLAEILDKCTKKPEYDPQTREFFVKVTTENGIYQVKCSVVGVKVPKDMIGKDGQICTSCLEKQMASHKPKGVDVLTQVVGKAACTDKDKKPLEAISKGCFKDAACNVVSSAAGVLTLGLASPAMRAAFFGDSKDKNSCFATQKDDCLTTFMTGMVKDIWMQVKFAGDLIKLGWTGIKKLFGSKSVQKNENRGAEASLLSSHTNPEKVEKHRRSPWEFIKDFVNETQKFIADAFKNNFGCAQWAGIPHFSECNAPFEWGCLNCSQYLNLTCGFLGIMGGEVVTAVLGGAVFKGIIAGGKSAAKVARVDKFVKEFVSKNSMVIAAKEMAQGAGKSIARKAGRTADAVKAVSKKVSAASGRVVSSNKYIKMPSDTLKKVVSLGAKGTTKAYDASLKKYFQLLEEAWAYGGGLAVGGGAVVVGRVATARAAQKSVQLKNAAEMATADVATMSKQTLEAQEELKVATNKVETLSDDLAKIEETKGASSKEFNETLEKLNKATTEANLAEQKLAVMEAKTAHSIKNSNIADKKILEEKANEFEKLAQKSEKEVEKAQELRKVALEVKSTDGGADAIASAEKAAEKAEAKAVEASVQAQKALQELESLASTRAMAAERARNDFVLLDDDKVMHLTQKEYAPAIRRAGSGEHYDQLVAKHNEKLEVLQGNKPNKLEHVEKLNKEIIEIEGKISSKLGDVEGNSIKNLYGFKDSQLQSRVTGFRYELDALKKQGTSQSVIASTEKRLIAAEQELLEYRLGVLKETQGIIKADVKAEELTLGAQKYRDQLEQLKAKNAPAAKIADLEEKVLSYEKAAIEAQKEAAKEFRKVDPRFSGEYASRFYERQVELQRLSNMTKRAEKFEAVAQKNKDLLQENKRLQKIADKKPILEYRQNSLNGLIQGDAKLQKLYLNKLNPRDVRYVQKQLEARQSLAKNREQISGEIKKIDNKLKSLDANSERANKLQKDRDQLENRLVQTFKKETNIASNIGNKVKDKDEYLQSVDRKLGHEEQLKSLQKELSKVKEELEGQKIVNPTALKEAIADAEERALKARQEIEEMGIKPGISNKELAKDTEAAKQLTADLRNPEIQIDYKKLLADEQAGSAGAQRAAKQYDKITDPVTGKPVKARENFIEILSSEDDLFKTLTSSQKDEVFNAVMARLEKFHNGDKTAVKRDLAEMLRGCQK